MDTLATNFGTTHTTKHLAAHAHRHTGWLRAAFSWPTLVALFRGDDDLHVTCHVRKRRPTDLMSVRRAHAMHDAAHQIPTLVCCAVCPLSFPLVLSLVRSPLFRCRRACATPAGTLECNPCATYGVGRTAVVRTNATRPFRLPEEGRARCTKDRARREGTEGASERGSVLCCILCSTLWGKCLTKPEHTEQPRAGGLCSFVSMKRALEGELDPTGQGSFRVLPPPNHPRARMNTARFI